MDEEVKYKAKLTLFWMVYFLGGWAIALIHESAHAVAALLVGAKIEKFHPYPGWQNDKLLVGWVDMKEIPNDPKKIQFIYAAPVIVSALILLVSSMLAFTINKNFLYLGVILGMPDILTWFNDYLQGPPECDAQKYKEYGRL